MKVRFKQGLYDVVINEGNVELQSLTETIIFPNAGKELTEDAERAFYSAKYAGQRLNGFISEYIDGHIQYYIETHAEDAQVVTNDLN